MLMTTTMKSTTTMKGTAPSATPTIDALLAITPKLLPPLQQHRAALGDGRDCTSDNEKATYRRRYDEVQRAISGLMNDPADLAREQRLLAELEPRRTAVVQKQAEIEQQIAAAPDWRSFADGRQRDREYDRQRDLARQRERLHEGTLLLAPGIAYARLSDLDARIADIQQRIARLRTSLEAHVKRAEALLAEPVTG